MREIFSMNTVKIALTWLELISHQLNAKWTFINVSEIAFVSDEIEIRRDSLDSAVR